MSTERVPAVPFQRLEQTMVNRRDMQGKSHANLAPVPFLSEFARQRRPSRDRIREHLADAMNEASGAGLGLRA